MNVQDLIGVGQIVLATHIQAMRRQLSAHCTIEQNRILIY